MYYPRLYYQVNNDDDYEKMIYGIQNKEQELSKLKNKFFQTSKVKREIIYIENDIQGAKKACEEYISAKKQLLKERDALLYKLESKVTGTTFRKTNVNKAVKFIVEEIGLDYYEGMTNKDIEEWYDRVYRYSGFFTNNFNLLLEPENEVDMNAVPVYISDYHIGYLPKDEALKIKPFLENYDYKIKGIISIIGGPYKEYDYTDDKVIIVKDNIGFEIIGTVLNNSLL